MKRFKSARKASHLFLDCCSTRCNTHRLAYRLARCRCIPRELRALGANLEISIFPSFERSLHSRVCFVSSTVDYIVPNADHLDRISGKRKFTDSAPEDSAPKVVKTEAAEDVKASETVKTEPELDLNAKLEAAGEFPFFPEFSRISLTTLVRSRGCC